MLLLVGQFRLHATAWLMLECLSSLNSPFSKPVSVQDECWPLPIKETATSMPFPFQSLCSLSLL